MLHKYHNRQVRMAGQGARLKLETCPARAATRVAAGAAGAAGAARLQALLAKLQRASSQGAGGCA